MDLSDGVPRTKMLMSLSLVPNLGSSSNSHLEKETMVGFEDEAMKLIERLTGTRNQHQLEVISIVGMAGLGKTTLAREVYDDAFITHHFHIRAWTYVSQVHQKRNMLLGILDSVIELTDQVYQMSDEKLSELLRKRLMGTRYLIVMDDIWDIGAWNDLKRCFPNNKDGSKIMITSRLVDVPSRLQPHNSPHYLRFLTEDESWILLKQKVFPGEECSVHLTHIGKEIARKCQGLPLAIVVISGLLGNQETLNWWREVAKNVSSYIVSDQNQYMETLALSYNHLPHHLKACFLYFGAFPEDLEILVRNLIWVWIAEGFIHQVGWQSLEDVATDYLMDLINRSLVMVSKKGTNGGIKTCRIHDLLRDLCLRKAKEENYAPQLYWYERLSFSSSYFTNYPHSLCIDSHGFHRLPSMDFGALLLYSAIESIKFLQECTPFGCKPFRILRVLDLLCANIPSFPEEVVQLIELRYCALRVKKGSPPTSISDLENLETLIVSSKRHITIPQSIWKMVKLRHLCIKSGVNDIEKKEEVRSADYPFFLINLQSISLISPSQACEDVLARSPNLRKLGLCGPLITESTGSLMFPDLSFSTKLETLKLLNTSITPNEGAMSCNPMKFPERLKKLTLSNTALDWNEVWTLGMLPKLEVLKLKLHACVGRQWETSEEGFQRLKYLKLQDLDIVEWNASDNHFPSLQHLVLHGCKKLKEIPSGVGDISTLEMIEVSWCSYSASISAYKIQTEQEKKGNYGLKLLIMPQVDIPSALGLKPFKMPKD